ncbi:hypothetical protein NO263_16610 [Gluconacetobacter entanii]|uniref:Uncharacterized protein n=1 Tax=Gluconacetobacter entanii TaxID=108528 RepID=A0ABT3K9W7_9PROT|nr:hypothetical protein [Gluconacetobacter entanii]MCW4592208.1 hypothetical protein [Gluconacetobacter entanii]MCW4595783.1 hypothetical protein [Gluconacetobacter entanii]NPC87423.1 hypothetical protein [Gluconacetobacter entanii]
MILRTDRDAIILVRNTDDACLRLELREGAIWSEITAGTSGIGTGAQDCPLFLGGEWE